MLLTRLSLYYFSYFAFIGIFMPYFALYLQHRGLAAGQIGMLMALMQVMRLLAPNLWGWLADRLGQRLLVLRLAALCSLLGFAALAWAQVMPTLALCIAVMGFFWTAQSPLAEALSLGLLRERPGGYGKVRAWGSVGFVVAVLAMGARLEQASLDWVYHGGLIALAAIFITAWGLPAAPPVVTGNAVAGEFRQRLLHRPVLVLLTACMLMTAAHGAFNVFYSMHLVNAGHAKALVGGLWTLGVVAEILVFQFAPRLMQRYSVVALLLFALIVAVPRFMLIGWGVDSLLVLVFAQVLHGITFGLTHITAISAINHHFGEHNAAQGQAVFGSVVYGAGGILGSLAAGWMWELGGGAWAFTVCAVFAALGACLLWRQRSVSVVFQ